MVAARDGEVRREADGAVFDEDSQAESKVGIADGVRNVAGGNPDEDFGEELESGVPSPQDSFLLCSGHPPLPWRAFTYAASRLPRSDAARTRRQGSMNSQVA